MTTAKEILAQELKHISEEARDVLELVRAKKSSTVMKERQVLTREELIRRAARHPEFPNPNAPPFEQIVPIETRGVPASELLIAESPLMLYYLDASAWVKRYFDEIGSSFVRDLFAGRWDFCCSPLGFIEVGSTIARKRKAGEVTLQESEMKRASLLNDWRSFLQVEMTPAAVQRLRCYQRTWPPRR